jgi:thiol-disulfide isomerase/thioredoxin
MARPALVIVLIFLGVASLAAQDSSDPVTQALAQGDLFQAHKKYDLALDAYRKADKLSHHTSAPAYLKMALTERKIGDFSAALDDAKKGIKAAAGDNRMAAQALQVHATFLAQMAGKPLDKKLKEAEQDLRQALTLDPVNSLRRRELGIILLRQERDAEGISELNSYLASPGATPAGVAEARLFIANPVRARTPFAPEFSFTVENGQSISNASLKGKVVLMDFWGTWCPPCRESVPVLKDLNKKYAGKPFQLVGISSDNNEDAWKSFIQSHQMDWAEYIDLSEQVLQAFKIDSFPTYVVLDKDGVVRLRQSGLDPETAADLADAINKALKREPDPKLAVQADDAAASGLNGGAAGAQPSKGHPDPPPADTSQFDPSPD